MLDGTNVEWGDFPAIRYGLWTKVQDRFGTFYVPGDVGMSREAIGLYCMLDSDNEIVDIFFEQETGFGCRFVDKNGDNNKCWELLPSLYRAENTLYGKVRDNPKWADVISDVGDLAMEEAREQGYEGD